MAVVVQLEGGLQLIGLKRESLRFLAGFRAFFLKTFRRRGERTRTSGLYVPNVALYRAELHPAFSLNACYNRRDLE